MLSSLDIKIKENNSCMVHEILDDGKLVNRFLWTFGHLLKSGVASCFKWILHISPKSTSFNYTSQTIWKF